MKLRREEVETSDQTSSLPTTRGRNLITQGTPAALTAIIGDMSHSDALRV